jgi:hypothetical protein
MFALFLGMHPECILKTKPVSCKDLSSNWFLLRFILFTHMFSAAGSSFSLEACSMVMHVAR